MSKFAEMDHQQRKLQARQALQRGEIPRARNLLIELTGEIPGDKEVWHLLTAVCGMTGDLEGAERCARKVLSLEPRHLGAEMNLGNALLQMGRETEAEGHFRRALEIDPGHAEAANNLGSIQAHQGRHDEAADCFRRAMAARPQYVDPVFNLAVVEQSRQRWDTALGLYQRVLAMQPGSVDAALSMADILHHQHRIREAMQCYQEVLHRDPNRIGALLGLGRVLNQVGRSTEARDLLERALALDANNVDILFALASAHKTLGEEEGAKQRFQRVLELEPGHTQARYFLAALSGDAIPERADAEYVARLFDGYAEKFDEHLVGSLEYRTPEHLADLIGAHLRDRKLARVYDLGCGTGLMSNFLSPLAEHLVGVDLSPKMIEKARLRAAYDDLRVADLQDALAEEESSCDLIVAADVLNYLGQLDPVINAVTRALRPGGYFAFSVEHLDQSGRDYLLHLKGRYAHNPSYVTGLFEVQGLVLVEQRKVTLRRDEGVPVPGDLYLVQRPTDRPRQAE